MRVLLYHPWIYLKSGLERTILQIAQRSRHEWVFYTHHYDPEGTYPELRRYPIQEVDRVSVQRNYGAVLDASIRIARTRLPLDGVDALVVSCDGVGSFITLRNGALPALNLCFTPLRAVYDQAYRERHLLRQGNRKWLALLIERAYRLVDRRLWKRYSQIVCISETVRERAIEGALAERDEMLVLYPGVDGNAISPSMQFDHFFFLPGRIMWTKNIELGIAAFLQLRKATGTDYQLIIAGMVDSKNQHYYERLMEMAGTDQGIRFHIDPTDQEMDQYYKTCGAVLFTSFNEDLGLTPMEAMARGKPVVAVNSGGPREVVVHHQTGYLVHADPNSFSTAMEALIADEPRQRQMGRIGAEEVKRFTWEKFVDGLDSALDAMVAREAQ